MLGQHPELYGFPELHAFGFPTIAVALEESNDGMAGLARAVAEVVIGKQDAEGVRAAREWLVKRSELPPVDVFRLLLDVVAPRIGVEKTPATAMREDELTTAMKAFPEARYLHLIRHPVAAQASMQHMLPVIPSRGGELRQVGSKQAMELTCSLIWYRTHRRLQRVGADMPADRWKVLRAEDLLANPQTCLPNVCEWLGISREPEAIASMCHPERSPYARFGPPEAWGGGDPGFLAAPDLRIGGHQLAAPFPSDWSIPDKMKLATRELALAFGYEVPM